MIDLKKEVNEFLGSVKHIFENQTTDEFKRWSPSTKHELILFYKFTFSYLTDNVQHEVPVEIKEWKGRVLDFGGGAGNVSVFLAENGNHVDYIDINYLQQEFMRWLRNKYSLNITIITSPTGIYLRVTETR